MQSILFLETWRWCFFFAGFVPIHYMSEGAVRLAEMVVESKLFTVQQALYFAVSIHVISYCRLILPLQRRLHVQCHVLSL